MEEHEAEVLPAIREPDQGALVPVVDSEIGSILRLAIKEKVTPEALEKIVALKERMEDRAAAKAFNVALAGFQEECPFIPKESKAFITHNSGGEHDYAYAELDTIARVIRPLLVKHGFSYTWDSTVATGLLTATCFLWHIDGHSKKSSFSCPTDSKLPQSGAQKTAGALTYAKRQSLVAVLGLTMTEVDNDGADEERINDQQAMEIEDMIQNTRSNRERFYAYMGVRSVGEILASDYKKAMMPFQDWIAKQQQKGGA